MELVEDLSSNEDRVGFVETAELGGVICRPPHPNDVIVISYPDAGSENHAIVDADDVSQLIGIISVLVLDGWIHKVLHRPIYFQRYPRGDSVLGVADEYSHDAISIVSSNRSGLALDYSDSARHVCFIELCSLLCILGVDHSG